MTGHILAVEIPHVPFGPTNVDEREADAISYRAAADGIRSQASYDGSFASTHLTEAIAQLCEAVAAALETDLDAWRTLAELAQRQGDPNGLEGVL